MVKIVRSFPLVFTLTALLGSCNFQDSKTDMQEDFTYTNADLHYTQVNNRIIAPYCLSCHAAATGNQGGINLETLTSLSQRVATLNRVVLVEKSMPKSGNPTLPPGALDMFGAWLRAGTPE